LAVSNRTEFQRVTNLENCVIDCTSLDVDPAVWGGQKLMFFYNSTTF